jgi:hypothetical protein
MLKKQQKLFIDYYFKTNCAKQAYIAAGYKGKDVAAAAHQVMANEEVQKEIQKRQKRISGAFVVTETEILAGIYKEATCGDNKTSDKLKAWELLAKAKGMFTEKYIIEQNTTQTRLDIDLSKLSDSQIRALLQQEEEPEACVLIEDVDFEELKDQLSNECEYNDE